MLWNSPRRHRAPRPFQPRLEALEDRLVPTVAPVLTIPMAQNSSEGQTASLLVSASDADGDSLTFSAVGLPSGLTINPSTGVISGFVGYGNVASGAFPNFLTATLSVSDGSASDGGTF